MLTDCLETCQGNESCQSVNYETGLCVLFGSNADVLPGKCQQAEFLVLYHNTTRSAENLNNTGRKCVHRHSRGVYVCYGNRKHNLAFSNDKHSSLWSDIDLFFNYNRIL